MVHSKYVHERFRIVGLLFGDLQKRWPSLRRYRLRLGTSKQALAYCVFQHKHLVFDANFLDVATLDTIHHVLVHECAHALCGPYRVAHGPAWRRMCKRLGQECPEERYTYYQPNCGRFESHKQRREAVRQANADVVLAERAERSMFERR